MIGREGLDERFRPVTTLNQVTGKITRRSYMCCGLEWEADGEGNTTRFEYDVLGRVIRRQVGYKDPLTLGNTLAVLSDEA